ncbi:MAG: ATP synthase F1 subunit delta [Ruminococcaceae bacterium]|nr:ATP synthase F1 subunit delta [Oscillospiraceae bacterium]
MTELSKDYAEALFALAVECGQEKPYLEALEAVDALFADHPDYLDLLAAPSIPQGERAGLIEQALGDRLPEQVLSFVQLLTAHGRIRTLPACTEEYRRLYQAAVALSTAYVTSAVALTEDQKTRLSEKLAKKFGRRIELVCEVDEHLLGGLTVRLDGVVLDGSLRHRLQEVKDVMEQ